MAKSSQIQKRQDARKNRIIDIVRKTPNASRTLIQRLTRLSMESTLRLVNELLDEGLLLGAGKMDSNTAGRKARLLRVNPEGCFSIGIRFNARYVTGAVINFEHKPVFTESMLIGDNASTGVILETLKTCVFRLLDAMGERKERLVGIGIGTPGVLDLPNEVVKRYVHVPDWNNVPLRELMQQSFPWPISIEHGVKCAIRALLMRPEYQNAKNLLLVQMERGVNMGMLLNGHLYHGSTNIAGEIGHVCAVEDGIPCACGQTGCLETVASDAALLEHIRGEMAQGGFQRLGRLAGENREITIGDLVRSCELGDDEAAALLQSTGMLLAKTLAPVVTILNPDHLVVSGTLADSGVFRSAFLQTMGHKTLNECMDAAAVHFETYNDQQNAAGAARLAMAKRFSVGDVL